MTLKLDSVSNVDDRIPGEETKENSQRKPLKAKQKNRSVGSTESTKVPAISQSTEKNSTKNATSLDEIKEEFSESSLSDQEI